MSSGTSLSILPLRYGLACGATQCNIGGVLNLVRRLNLGAWPCLVACVLHLLAPLCHASSRFPPAHDTADRPLTVTDPLQRVTTNVYDGLGQLIKVIEPDPLTVTPGLDDNPTVRTFYNNGVQGCPFITWRKGL